MKTQLGIIWDNLKFTVLHDRTTTAILFVAGLVLGALIF